MNIFAHRGLSAQYPENTLIAFKKAILEGVDGIELDVQMTRDQQLVVIHDEKLDRTTTGTGWVKDWTLEELRSLDAGQWFSPEYKGEKVPLLAEVLELLSKANQKIWLNIELKNSLFPYDGMEAKVLELVETYGLKSQVIFSSFNHHSLRKIHELDETVETALLVYGTLYEPEAYMGQVGAKALHTCLETLNSELVTYCKSKQIPLRVYTVNSSQELAWLEHLGSVAGIFSDDAVEMKKRVRV